MNNITLSDLSSLVFEPGTRFSLPLLQAHLYYRSLSTISSLVTTWLQDCKDRQVSTSFSSLTSAHFSPLIIRLELDRVKTPSVLEELETENLKIKVLTVVNEITASYSVDEQQLEIKLKIPVDWPLHKIEIRDVKKVGVDENRWRAWVFGVQQIIWTQVCRWLIISWKCVTDDTTRL